MIMYSMKMSLEISALLSKLEKSIAELLIFLGFIAFTGSAVAQPIDKQSSAYVEDLRRAGYPTYTAKSFLERKLVQLRFAETTLHKIDGNEVIFRAYIVADADGAGPGFIASTPCAVSPLSDEIIRISEHKIQVAVSCSSSISKIYVIKSKAGIAFATKEFSKRKSVFVHFDGLPVPFLTDGFSQALAELDGKAL